MCIHVPDDSRCPDPDFCDGADVCAPLHPDVDADGCVGTGNPCANPTPVCNQSTQSCEQCTTSAQCDDDVPCTDNSCDGGICVMTPGSATCPDIADCDGVDYCDPSDSRADADGCVQPGNPCAPKLCTEGVYVPSDSNTCTDCAANSDCDDGITCTQDTCDGLSGACYHSSDDRLCPDPDFCDGEDTCDPGHPEADVNGCIGHGDPCAPKPCDEVNDMCVDCTANADCDDSISCTDDFCNGATGDCAYVDNCASGSCLGGADPKICDW